jgi:hypothetical protein
VDEDLEYYRTKRLERRIFFMIRRGHVTLSDLLGAKERIPIEHRAPEHSPGNLEGRVRTLEDSLDDYVRSIGLLMTALARVGGVNEVIRKERGDYVDVHEDWVESSVAST